MTTVNEKGLSEIHQFLADNHKKGGDHFNEEMLRAWDTIYRNLLDWALSDDGLAAPEPERSNNMTTPAQLATEMADRLNNNPAEAQNWSVMTINDNMPEGAADTDAGRGRAMTEQDLIAADGQPRLTDGLATHEVALLRRVFDCYNKNNMLGSRDFYEEATFDSLKNKLLGG